MQNADWVELELGDSLERLLKSANLDRESVNSSSSDSGEDES